MRFSDVNGGLGGLDPNSTRDDVKHYLNPDSKQTPLTPLYDVKTETHNPPGMVF